MLYDNIIFEISVFIIYFVCKTFYLSFQFQIHVQNTFKKKNSYFKIFNIMDYCL